MKVFNLRCTNDHAFEGWFGSEADYAGQQERGLIECPLCGTHEITRLPSAPRLNLSSPREPGSPAAAGSSVAAAPAPVAAGAPALQQLYLQAVRRILDTTEDVGPRFAEEARRIHYGEADARGIRGQASAAESEALREEGIEVMPLPIPAALKGPVQ